MKWFQGFPPEIPPRRAYVDWDGLIERVTIGSSYGLSLVETWRYAGSRSFGWLEWDIAIDAGDLLALEGTASRHPGVTITAPVQLYEPTTQGRRYVEEHSFGIVVFPESIFRQHQDRIAQLAYPTADADYRREIQESLVCREASPKHLHWIGGKTF